MATLRSPEIDAMAALPVEDSEDEDAAFAAELEACMDSDEAPDGTSLDAAAEAPDGPDAVAGPDLLTCLPEEILARILSFLPNASLLGSALRWTNRRFGQAVALASIERTRERLRQSLEDGFTADASSASNSGCEGSSAGESSHASSGSDGRGSAAGNSDAESVRREAGPPSSPTVGGTSSGTGAETSGTKSPAVSRHPLPDQRERLDSLASELELALRACVTATFRSKYRQLVFNLRDPKNPQLRKRLLTGELAPDALLQLSGRDMASVELQQQRSEWKKKRQRECVRERPVKGFVTDLYRCDRCDGTRAAVHRALRAGQRHVDRARTYATCTECNHRWEL
jgi:hypothetical protein